MFLKLHKWYHIAQSITLWENSTNTLERDKTIRFAILFIWPGHWHILQLTGWLVSMWWENRSYICSCSSGIRFCLLEILKQVHLIIRIIPYFLKFSHIQAKNPVSAEKFVSKLRWKAVAWKFTHKKK